MGGTPLAGKRILVAGASAGIGRALAVRAVRDGARVLMAARRKDVLDQVIADAGGGERVAADVSREQDCAAIAEAARAHLGGIDVLVWCVGVARLQLLADTATEDWHELFETNVWGAHRVLRACLPLFAPRAMVIVLSSEAVHQPRTTLSAYATSKAALERLVEGWRDEHPSLRYTRVTVGQTVPTEFGVNFEHDLLTWALTDWGTRGLAQQEFMDTDEVAGVLAGMIATTVDLPGVGLEHLTLRSPSPIVGTFDEAIGDLPEAGLPEPGLPEAGTT